VLVAAIGVVANSSRSVSHDAGITGLKAPTLILDGEVCVFDKQLVSQFHLLGGSDCDELCTPPVFMAFDCLHGHGFDVRGLPLQRRRAML